jgi:hypothetical protein
MFRPQQRRPSCAYRYLARSFFLSSRQRQRRNTNTRRHVSALTMKSSPGCRGAGMSMAFDRAVASSSSSSHLPAPYAYQHHTGGTMDTTSSSVTTRMSMSRGLLPQRHRPAAAPFWNSTAAFQTLASSFSTTSIQTSSDDQEPKEKQDREHGEHEEAFAAIGDEATSPTTSIATSPTTSTTSEDNSTAIIVTTFDMRRACTDILECLPDPPGETHYSNSHHRPKVTWKYTWQRACTSARYEQQQEQHQQEQRTRTATYADADAYADGGITSPNGNDSTSTNASASASTNNDEAIHMALALLRVLPEDAWENFDALGLQGDDDDDFDDDFDDDEVVCEENELFVNTEQPEQTSDYSGDAHLVQQDVGDEQHDDQDDNDYDDDGDYDEIARLLDMVADAKVGRLVLKTSDYNTILARFAIAPELTVERTLENVMQTYQQMVEMAKVGMTDSGPDATTYELLMLTLNRRLSSSNTAVEIMQQMMSSRGVGWTPQTMKAAFQLCQGRKDLKSARVVLKDVVADKSRSFKIPSGVLLAYSDMLKSEDAQNEALELLELSMEVSTGTVCAARYAFFGFGFLTIEHIIPQEQTGDRSQGLDDVLVSCIRWPQRDRNGQSIDNTLFLSKILRILEADASNPAGFYVWKQFIVECAKRKARQNASRWELVQRVLKKLSTDNPRFWPDHLLLKCGLEASEFLLDSELASTLIARALEHDGEVQAPRTDNTFESDMSHLLSDSKEFSFGIKAETNPNNAFESDLSHLMSDSKQWEWADGPSFDETKSTEIDAAGDEPTHGASLELPPVGAAADESTYAASLEVPPVGRSRVVFRDILKGMEICVHGSDMRSGRLILDSVDAFPEAVPVEGKRALYSLGLKGFAVIGDFESAEQLLSAMILNDLKPG